VAKESKTELVLSAGKKIGKNQNGGVGIYIEIKNSIVVPIKLQKNMI
jgi:hypothetical protein